MISNDDSEKREREIAFKVYDSLWQNINREDTLVGVRLTWAISTTSGFMIATSFLMSILMNLINDDSDLSRVLALGVALSAIVLAAIGIRFSEAARKGVVAAQEQIGALKMQYSEKRQDMFDRYSLPRPFGAPRSFSAGMLAANDIAKTLTRVWIFFISIEAVGASLLAGRTFLGWDLQLITASLVRS